MIDVADAAVTVAACPLNLTVLFAIVGLKFVPEIVTGIPATPDDGASVVIVGSLLDGMVNDATLLNPP